MLQAVNGQYNINEYVKKLSAELFKVCKLEKRPGHADTCLHQDSLGDVRTESWQLEN